jgi:hypothetical protein
MMVSYKAMRDAVTTALSDAFKAVRAKVTVESGPGLFSEESIRLLSQRAPALVTSLMRVRPADAPTDQVLEMVTWVVVRGDSADRLFDQALVLMSLLVPTLRDLDAPWSIGGAEGIDATNRYTTTGAAINLSLWAVKWNWTVRAFQIGDAEGGVLTPDELALFEGADAETTLQ